MNGDTGQPKVQGVISVLTNNTNDLVDRLGRAEAQIRKSMDRIIGEGNGMEPPAPRPEDPGGRISGTDRKPKQPSDLELLAESAQRCFGKIEKLERQIERLNAI